MVSLQKYSEVRKYTFTELVSFLPSGSYNYSRANKIRLRDTARKSMAFFLKNPSHRSPLLYKQQRVVVNLQAAEGKDVYKSQST